MSTLDKVSAILATVASLVLVTEFVTYTDNHTPNAHQVADSQIEPQQSQTTEFGTALCLKSDVTLSNLSYRSQYSPYRSNEDLYAYSTGTVTNNCQFPVVVDLGFEVRYGPYEPRIDTAWSIDKGDWMLADGTRNPVIPPHGSVDFIFDHEATDAPTEGYAWVSKVTVVRE